MEKEKNVQERFVVYAIIADHHKPELTLVKEKWIFKDGLLVDIDGPYYDPPIRIQTRDQEEFAELQTHVVLTGARTGNTGPALGVEVRNDGATPLVVDEVWFEYLYEVPQAERIAGLDAFAAGASFRLAPNRLPLDPVDFKAPLSPGEERAFIVPAGQMPLVKSLVASLSPERYWLSVRSLGLEVRRIEGREIGDTVHGLP